MCYRLFCKAAGFILYLIFIVPVILLADEAANFTITHPPGSVLEDTHNMRMGQVTTYSFLYKINLDKESARKYYLNYMKANDFILKAQRDSKRGRAVYQFRKGDLVVNISLTFISDRKTKVAVTQFSYPKEELDFVKKPPYWDDYLYNLSQEKECSGEDLKVVPRPPESIRVSRAEFRGSVKLFYHSKLSAAELRDFYLKRMPLYNWKLIQDVSMSKAMNDIDNYVDSQHMPKLPFADIEFMDLVKGGSTLVFMGPMGTAEIGLINKNDPNYKGCLVQIKYGQR